jgi:hypothetical protein
VSRRSGKANRFGRGGLDRALRLASDQREAAESAPSLIGALDGDHWRQRRDMLLARTDVTPHARVALERMQFGAQMPPRWIREQIERIEVALHLALVAPEPQSAEAREARAKERRRVKVCRFAAFNEARAARPAWMSDPSLLPKRPPTRREG